MKILVTGATGFIGRALVSFLQTRGQASFRLTRQPRQQEDISWDPAAGELDLSPFNFDAVVHLAGENIASGRWTPTRKKRILESREKGTRLLCEHLAAMDSPPKVLVSASGINYYPGNTGEACDESGPSGNGFLSMVCRAWEASTAPAVKRGIRVVNLRLGMVLSPEGGALAKMLPFFKLGLGGLIGRGRQHLSWIALDDTIEVIYTCLFDDGYSGPVNTVAPQPVTNCEFTRTLAKLLKRPAFFPIPVSVVKLVFGQMGQETLLADHYIVPKSLLENGYTFRYPSLQAALGYYL